MYRRNGPTSLSKAHDGSVSSCFISNDGELCVSSGYDMRIVLWDIEHATPKLILRGHSDWINDVAITKDNKWIVSVGKDKAIREWYVENYENIKLVAEKNKTLGNKLIKVMKTYRFFS
jgi:WD40 repeat protein